MTVLSLLLMAVPGYLLVKAKMLNKSAESVLSAIVLYGAQPVLMFTSFQKTYQPEIAVNMLVVAGVALVVHLVMIGILSVVIKNKNNESKLNCVKFASIFSNCGYMGLPFLKMLFGETNSEILIYGAVVIAVFSLLTWSLGIFIVTGDKKQMSVKKAFFNPTCVAIYIGALMFFLVQKPLTVLAMNTPVQELTSKLMTSVNIIGDLVTPLSMLLIGVKLANIKLKELFLNKWAYLSCFFKLIVMSVVTMLLSAFLPVSETVKYGLVFLLSMPSATATVLFAVQFGGDGETATASVLLSTVLSIITIPLMYLIFQQVFGVVLPI